MNSILIVEDHETVAQGLTYGFEAAGFAVSTCDGSAGHLAERLRSRPDLILLDLNLGPDRSGLDLLPQLSDSYPVAVLTGEQRPEVLADAYRAGAATVLDKAIPFQTLVEELRDIIEGRTESARARRDRIMHAARAAAAIRHGALEPFERLTRREQEVLGDLMDGLQALEIAARSYVSLTTVRSQIRSVLLKLGVKSQLAAVTKAVKAGWELPEKRPDAPETGR